MKKLTDDVRPHRLNGYWTIGEQQARAFNTTFAQQKQYDIRLFNLQGSLVRAVQSKGEQVSLDVSGLPGGNYFLHIYDGKSDKPLVQQIVIKHWYPEWMNLPSPFKNKSGEIHPNAHIVLSQEISTFVIVIDDIIWK